MKDKMVLYHKLGFKLFENIIYTFESDISDPNRIAEITEEILNPKFQSTLWHPLQINGRGE